MHYLHSDCIHEFVLYWDIWFDGRKSWFERKVMVLSLYYFLKILMQENSLGCCRKLRFVPETCLPVSWSFSLPLGATTNACWRPGGGLSLVFLPDWWPFGSILVCRVTLLWEQGCEGVLLEQDSKLSPCPVEHFDVSKTLPFMLSSRIFPQYPSWHMGSKDWIMLTSCCFSVPCMIIEIYAIVGCFGGFCLWLLMGNVIFGPEKSQ